MSCDTLDWRLKPKAPWAIRLAPDGKIYVSSAYEYGFPGYPYPDSVRNNVNENLSVINYPNSLGAACDYQAFSFYLGGKRTYYGLPNNPNYSLGPLIGSSCDTLTLIADLKEQDFNFSIYPNPVSDQQLKIFYLLPQNKSGVFEMFDINGRKVYSLKLPQWSTLQTISLPELSDGLYQCVITSGSVRVSKKMAVINE